MYTNITIALKPNFMSSLLFMLYLFKYGFSSISRKTQNLHKKDTERFAFHIFLSKMLSSLLYFMLKLSKTTSPQKLFPSDCITLYLTTRIYTKISTL